MKRIFSKDRVQVFETNQGWVRILNGEGGDGVAVLAMLPDSRSILVQERRYLGVSDTMQLTWGIPRGGRAPMEAPLDAAVRELGEETGYVVARERLTYLGRLYPDNGVLLSAVHFFFVELTEEEVAQRQATDGEVERVQAFTDIEIIRMARNGELTDMMTYAAFSAVAFRDMEADYLLTNAGNA